MLCATPAFAQRETSRSFPPLTALGSSAMLDVSSYGTASVEVQQIGSMTLTFYVSNTGTLLAAQPISLTQANSTTSATTATAVGVWKGDIASFKYLHVVVTAYTSGTATVTLSAIGLSQGVASGGGGTINGAVKLLDGVGGVNQAQVNGSSQLSVVCANCTGSGVSQIDTSGFTPASTVFVPVGGEVDDTSTAALSEGQAGAARLTAQRAVHTNLRNNGGTEIATSSNPLRVDPTGSTAQPVTDNGTSLTIDAPVGTPAFVRLSDGAAAIATLPVSLASVPAHNVTNAGTFVVQENGAALTALQLIDNLPNTQGSTTSGQSGVLTLCATTTAAPTNTTGQSNAFSCDTSGAIRVTGSSGTTQFNEDSASADAQALVGVGFVRRDTTPVMSAGTAGDWAWGSIDANGRIYTQAVLYTAAGAELSPSVDATHDLAVITTGPQMLFESKDQDGVALPNVVSAEGDAVRGAASLYGVQYVMVVSEDGSTVGHIVCDSGCGAGTQYAEDSARASGDSLSLAGAVRQDTLATDTSADGDASFLKVTALGRLYTASDVTHLGGTAIATNTGNASAGTIRAVLATDQAALTGLGIYVEDGAETVGGNLAMVGSVRRDTPASSAGSSGDNATLNTSAVGALYVQPIAGAAGGATPVSVISAASTNSTSVKGSAGTLYSVTLVNTTATLYYLRLYNSAAAPTCSSATGYVATIPVPASTTGAGVVIPLSVGAAFSTGIGYCITGGPTSTDNTNAAVGIYGMLSYL